MCASVYPKCVDGRLIEPCRSFCVGKHNTCSDASTVCKWYTYNGGVKVTKEALITLKCCGLGKSPAHVVDNVSSTSVLCQFDL